MEMKYEVARNRLEEALRWFKNYKGKDPVIERAVGYVNDAYELLKD